MGQFGKRTVLPIVMNLKSSICEDIPKKRFLKFNIYLVEHTLALRLDGLD